MNQMEDDSSHSEEGGSICIICDKIIQENDKTQEVKEKGIERFIKSSKQRKDNKHKVLSNLNSIVIHNTCFCTYNRESSIAAAKKRLSSEIINTRKEYAKIRSFDFSKLCFFLRKCSDK